MRTMGTVKWFDPATGEGCAVSDGGTQAALTAAALKPFGLSTIEAGAALVYDVRFEGGRLVVATIHELAGQPPADPMNPQPGATGRVKGRVQWFSTEKGYGFVVSKDLYCDVLLHRSVIEAFGIGQLLEGAILDFDYVMKVKGLHATRIHAVLAPEKPLPPPVERPPTGGSIVIGGIGRVRGRRFGAHPVVPPIVLGPSSQGFGLVLPGSDEPSMEEAECKWFSRPKGFGFVVTKEGREDIFVHMDVLRRCGVRELRQGQRVRVAVEETERGLTAVAIEELDDDA